MIKKLRIRFVCAIMAIVLPLSAVVLGVLFYFTGENMKDQNISMMRTVADTPVRRGKLGRTSIDESAPFFVVRVDREGTLIDVSEGSFDLSDQEYLETIIAAAMGAEKADELHDHSLRFMRDKNPDGYTIVFSDITEETASLKKLFVVCLGIYFVTAGLFLVISIHFSHRITKPVETAWEQQRQFVADASHELKTPLSVILANAELLESGQTGEADLRTFSRNILTTSYQMRSLVESLLEMARVDNGAQMQFAPLDFSQITEDAVLSFRLLYEENGLKLQSNLAEDISLSGSERHLYQVLDVLLDNAMKYSTPGSTVRVDLGRCGHNCLLTVENTGEPISKEDLKNIFKRFYRVDKARSLNGSYGLGLSIAESIVQSHRGKIWAESRDGCNTLHVQLPMKEGN